MIALTARLSGIETAYSVMVIWAIVGFPLLLIVVGRLNREHSAGAQLVYLVGLAALFVLMIVAVYRIRPFLSPWLS